MIPFAKHQTQFHASQIYNSKNIFYCSAYDDKERFSTQFVVASSGYMRGGIRQFDYNHKVDKLVSTELIASLGPQTYVNIFSGNF